MYWSCLSKPLPSNASPGNNALHLDQTATPGDAGSGKSLRILPGGQDMTLATFHLDHITPQVAGGATVFENLCLSCPFCNQFKGERWRARDPETRRLVALFNPRQDIWAEHFEWGRDGTVIVGLTSRGRATAHALQMNNLISMTARGFWVASGIHPPE